LVGEAYNRHSKSDLDELFSHIELPVY